MIPFDLAFFALAVPAVLFAAVSKAGFGSGAAFAAASILALALDPGPALGLMLPLLMLMDVAALPSYWRKWSWPDARPMLLGAVPGVALGAWLYRLAEPDVFRLMIGAICLGFVAWQLSGRWRGQRPVSARPRPRLAALSGLATGFTSFVSHAGGPTAAVYLLSRDLGKTGFQATTVLVFWAVNMMKVGLYAGLGIFTSDTMRAGLLLAPVALAGVWLGVRAHRVVPDRVYFTVAYLLLTVTGLRLIWIALT